MAKHTNIYISTPNKRALKSLHKESDYFWFNLWILSVS